MSDFTRLTVSGSTRRAELAVPSDQPLGAMLPQLIELLAEPVGTVARPLTLLSSTGESLQLERSPQEQNLGDGSALRLARLDSAPPPPVVIDVTDAVADSLAHRRDRWSAGARKALGAVIVAFATAGALVLMPLAQGGAFTVAVGVLVVLLAAAVAFGLGRLLDVSAILAAASAGAAVITAAEAEAVTDGGISLWSALVLALGAVLLLGVGVARRDRGAMAGGGIAIALGALLMLQLWMPPLQVAAITGVLCALLLGVLPWVALSTAGLTGLDQRASDGEPLSRATASVSIDDAYRALSWSVVATAAPLTISAAALASDGGLWPVLLALALAAVTLLRSRALPLRTQVLVLWTAGSLTAIAVIPALAVAAGPWLTAAAIVVIAVIAALGALVDPPAHHRARLRSLGNTVETLAVVALLPLTVGVFDVYCDLLSLFGGGA